jgi:hypothetical protein
VVDLAQPAFPDDDGAASPHLRQLLRNADVVTIARTLRDTRLLASVVAVADEVDASGAEKSSHMAVVSMVTTDGRRGLLAFTGVDALTKWNDQARPVPSWGRDLGRAACDDEAAAVVIDVAGPHTVVLEGAALAVLADQCDLVAVAACVERELAGLLGDAAVTVAVVDGRGLDLGVDVIVEVTPCGSPHGLAGARTPQQFVAQVARALQGSAELTGLAPGGLAVREA